MHATATQPNRHQRRNRSPKPRLVSVAGGHCDCELCGGCDWPRGYTLLVREVTRRSEFNTPRTREVLVGKMWVSYECFIHSLPYSDVRTERPIRGGAFCAPASDDVFTTESAQAMSAKWLEDEHYAGVDVDLEANARALVEQDQIESDRLLLLSLRNYLDACDIDDVQRWECEQRYKQIRREWGERDEWGLWQWLSVEFPGWLVRS